MTLTPQEAAAVYLWAVGDGTRAPPEDEEQRKLAGSGLVALTQIAGDELAYDPVDVSSWP